MNKNKSFPTNSKCPINNKQVPINSSIFTGRNKLGPRLYFYKRLSVHRGEGCLPQCMLEYPPPPGSRHPPPGPGTPGRKTPKGADIPPGADPPRPGRPPTGSRLQHTVVNERPVRILLECILVPQAV